jgi:hypothetical protein
MDTGVHGLNYDGDVRRETAETGVRVRSVPLALGSNSPVACEAATDETDSAVR